MACRNFEVRHCKGPYKWNVNKERRGRCVLEVASNAGVVQVFLALGVCYFSRVPSHYSNMADIVPSLATLPSDVLTLIIGLDALRLRLRVLSLLSKRFNALCCQNVLSFHHSGASCALLVLPSLASIKLPETSSLASIPATRRPHIKTLVIAKPGSDTARMMPRSWLGDYAREDVSSNLIDVSQ